MPECNRHPRIDVCRLVPAPDIVVALGKQGLVALATGCIRIYISFTGATSSLSGNHICHEGEATNQAPVLVDDSCFSGCAGPRSADSLGVPSQRVMVEEWVLVDLGCTRHRDIHTWCRSPNVHCGATGRDAKETRHVRP